jgi:hypothetical protein
MTSKMPVPEMTDSHEPKIRTMKDGTHKYYMGGFLHRDPYAGPAIEKPGANDISDCYVRGIMVDQKWYRHKLYQNLEEVLAAQKEEGDSSGTKPVLNGHGAVNNPNGGPKGITPSRPKVNYMPDPVQMAKPKKRDRFDQMAGRMKGDAMQDLQKLYAELSTQSNEHNG